MNFQQAISVLEEKLKNTGTTIVSERYDGIVVKKLEASNTLDEGRTTNQTHIAFTGTQMDIFPYLRSDGYFESDDASLKKYFITQIPVTLYETNVKYLANDNQTEIVFSQGKKLTSTSVIRSKRQNQADQLQVSLLNFDGSDFVLFRRLLHTGSYLIILKVKQKFEYEILGIKGADAEDKLHELNNQFFKLATNTTVNVNDLATSDNSSVKKSLVFNTEIKADKPRNRIIFGAPGTGKSFKLNEDRKDLLGADSETNYERVTFHPDYSYANFIGTYKPIMVSNKKTASDKDTDYVISILNDESKTAQEKYDVLFEKFKGDGLTRLPVLLGLYTDEMFKTRKQDGTDAAGDNSVERNHGKAIRKYVSLLTGKEVSSDIAYEYVPGPFMRVYVNALKSARSANPKPYLLLIEEINRANVAAVFGDIFQLLDRDEDEVSEYPIQASEDIKKYLAKELGGNPEDYNKIKIPDNMFIWATMNSADQGVFPMDTAFKRRWDFTYIGIDDNDDEIQGKYVILGNATSQKVEWNKLRKAINNFLAKQKINEDKQLGPYFLSRKIVVPESGNEIDSEKFCEAFKNKVIMYLFEDAAKQKRPSLFEGCFENSSRYSEICKEFDEKGVGIFNHEIGLDTDPEDIKINGTEAGETAEETE
ncbi:MAG: Type-2 restriction enzyme BsuMI component YdiS [Firmicutes bacterium ADurb.Bin146]|nr:MAG: Type-2 restriction enzyme BsuMI component YdiS [Firmicutes bacterium ADurb.Bin146]